MKLKYYLRGAGIGIIFATLVMTLSSFVHRYNLSDEYIIKEATKLGMVMKDEVNNNDGLWGNKDTEGIIIEETESELETEVETQETESQIQEPESPLIPEVPVISEPIEESEVSEETDTSERSDYIILEVVSGDTPRKVGLKLVDAGIIDDEVAFMNYVAARGDAKKLHKGTYSIPKGATLEEICKILFG